MVRLLYRHRRRRNPYIHPQRRHLLGALVLGHRPPDRQQHRRLRLPYDHAVLPLSSQLGTMDLRFCALLHRHQQRAPLLLRYVRSFQWCCAPVCKSAGFLALLGLLPHAEHLLDRRRHGRYPTRHPSHVRTRRNSALQPPTRPELRSIRLRLRDHRRSGIPHEP